MIWMIFVIPFALIMIAAIGYDFLVRKSFNEVKDEQSYNENVENAKRDASTVESNHFNGL